MEAFERGDKMDTKSAIQAMLDGNKVRRIHWGIDVFLYFDSPYFVNQDRHICDTFKDSGDWTFYEEPKPKQVVVIEKWLCQHDAVYIIASSSDIKKYVPKYWKPIKLLDTYEVEI